MKSGISIYFLGFAFILLNSTTLISQEFYDWSDPVPVTDSVSDNCNPYLKQIYANNNQQYMILVWERSVDTGSTAIYYRNLLVADEPMEVVSTPGVHYSHPKILNIDKEDTLIYIFYESDQNGNQDIFYSKLTFGGLLVGPFPFATTAEDEKGLCVGNESFWTDQGNSRAIVNTISWTENGTLLNCDFEKIGNNYSFSEPIVIDSNDCSDIFISNQDDIYWLREGTDSSRIYYSNRYTGSWSAPELLYEGDHYANMSGNKIAGDMLTWSYRIDTVWKIIISNTYIWGLENDTLEVESAEALDPCISSIGMWFGPAGDYLWNSFIAYSFPENDHMEIFLNNFPYGPEFMNFTQSNTNNRNPDFYAGDEIPWEPGCFYDYLVWESYRNEHWQLFIARNKMCIEWINEDSAKDNFIKISPNPFNNEVTVSYTLHSDESIKIEVIDIYGRKIKDLFSGKQLSGEQQIQWNGRDTGGNTVPDGIYFIRLSSDKLSACSRLIKVN
jgi:hypothetical protein